MQLKKELKQADLAALKEAADMYTVLSSSKITKKVTNLTGFLEEVERVKQQMYGGGGPRGQGPGGEGDGEGGISIPASEKELARDFPETFRFQVIGGVKRGQYLGDVIKVDIAKSIKGTPVTLEGVEMVVKRRVLKPNARNPETAEVHLETTKDQYFSVEKYGPELVNKIGPSFKSEKQSKYRYTLQLKAGKPEE